eukprot:COSAG01_NODE_30183_length_621_cov_0.871648_2_plen_124_part_01
MAGRMAGRCCCCLLLRCDTAAASYRHPARSHVGSATTTPTDIRYDDDAGALNVILHILPPLVPRYSRARRRACAYIAGRHVCGSSLVHVVGALRQPCATSKWGFGDPKGSFITPDTQIMEVLAV